MNQLETNLALWAICSILLFEILILICLCRCCFNRIKPKKFYVKREEYEYLQDFYTNRQSKFQPTILRPPHADELAHIGTIRAQNPVITYHGGYPNLGYYQDEKLSLPPPPIINTAQLLPADYEFHSYSVDDYVRREVPPRPTIIDFHPYRNDYTDDDDEIETYRLQALPRPEIILSQIQRIETSTDSDGNYPTNQTPKSILKTGTTPPIDSYIQTQRSRTPSKYDESPRTSVKIHTDQSYPFDYPTHVIEKRIPIPLSYNQRMKFANIHQLNDIEWEVPGEFQRHYTHYPRTPPFIIDSKRPKSWQHEINFNPPNDYLYKDDITQQQAFEY